MKSYAVDNKPIIALKKAIDIFAEGESFHHSMMLFCQSAGFQGHKRWNRLQSKEDRCHRINVENYVVDIFGDIIEPTWDFKHIRPTGVKEYLEMYLDWEIKVYHEISVLANELVSNNYPIEAELIEDCLSDVNYEIRKVRRWLKEYELNKWDMTYLLMDDKKLHEKVKTLE